MAFRYDRLKALRKEKGYKQVSLARDLHIGRSTLAMWETGQSEPNTDMCSRIAVLLDCSTGYLLGTEDEVNAKREFLDLREQMAKELENRIKSKKIEGDSYQSSNSRSPEWRVLSEGLGDLEKKNKAAFQATYNYLTAMYPDIFTERTDDDDSES